MRSIWYSPGASLKPKLYKIKYNVILTNQWVCSNIKSSNMTTCKPVGGDVMVTELTKKVNEKISEEGLLIYSIFHDCVQEQNAIIPEL